MAEMQLGVVRRHRQAGEKGRFAVTRPELPLQQRHQVHAGMQRLWPRGRDACQERRRPHGIVAAGQRQPEQQARFQVLSLRIRSCQLPCGLEPSGLQRLERRLEGRLPFDLVRHAGVQAAAPQLPPVRRRTAAEIVEGR